MVRRVSVPQRRQRLRRGAIKRANRTTGLRRLTDAEAAELLSDAVQKTVNEQVAWRTSGRSGDGTEVCMGLTVFNTLNEPLYIRGRIELAKPLESHWVFAWGTRAGGQASVNLRRLDLRDSHPNPDGQRWDKRSHKHLWSVADDNAWAYTPSDIPHDESPGFVGPDDYRSICEAFIIECGIGFGPDYDWTEPPLDAGPPALMALP